MDATMLGPGPTGAARYVRNLLAALPAADPGVTCVALVRSAVTDRTKDLALEVRGVEVRGVGGGSGLAWELRGMNREAHHAGADVFFTIRELVGRGLIPVVMHVFEPPQYRIRWGGAGRPLRARSKDMLLAATIRGSVRRAAGVTAGSAATSRWLRDHAGVEAPVVPPGIDPIFLEDPAEDATHGEPYLLHVASGDPREDTVVLLEAFAAAALPDCGLVLAGSASRDDGPLMARARTLGLGDRVRGEGRVSDPRLRDLYAGAIAYVHPTRYESFGGYTALEAMAQGTPVLSFDAPGTREALEGAALFSAIGSVSGLTETMRTIVGDPELRARLGEAGRTIAHGLTWDRTVRALRDALRAAAGTR